METGNIIDVDFLEYITCQEHPILFRFFIQGAQFYATFSASGLLPNLPYLSVKT